jgi:hypothetical protein
MVRAAFLLVVLVATGFSTSCRPPDGCVPRATRCLANRTQICDADRYWRELSDCDRVSFQSGAPFVCKFVDEETEEGRVSGHTCMPARDAGAEASR